MLIAYIINKDSREEVITFWGCQKLYVDFQLCSGSVPLLHLCCSRINSTFSLNCISFDVTLDLLECPLHFHSWLPCWALLICRPYIITQINNSPSSLPPPSLPPSSLPVEERLAVCCKVETCLIHVWNTSWKHLLLSMPISTFLPAISFSTRFDFIIFHLDHCHSLLNSSFAESLLHLLDLIL